jgi:hypothetical protein
MRDEQNGSNMASGAAGRRSRFRVRRSYLWALLAMGLVVGAGALGRASVPHTFNTGDTLAAADLNTNFMALDQRITALEAKEPFAGTYPAVKGRGTEEWVCGAAPANIVVDPTVPATGGGTYPDAYGNIIFTKAGAVSMNLSLSAATSACTGMTVCSSPLTYFLISPTAQTISINAYLDDTGAVYVNGAKFLTAAGQPITLSYTTMANTPFSISFMGCSNNGPSIGFTVNDSFITKYNLQVDYDATFHRNGK